jgi:hypothetical protein
VPNTREKNKGHDKKKSKTEWASKRDWQADIELGWHWIIAIASRNWNEKTKSRRPRRECRTWLGLCLEISYYSWSNDT